MQTSAKEQYHSKFEGFAKDVRIWSHDLNKRNIKTRVLQRLAKKLKITWYKKYYTSSSEGVVK